MNQLDFEPEHIAVLLLRQIGDVLLLTPVLAALRLQFPTARISVVVNDFTAAMLENNPNVDQIILYRRALKKRGWTRRIAEELRIWRAIWKAGFDVVIDLTSGDRPAFYARLSRARLRIAFAPTANVQGWKRKAYNVLVPRPDQQMHQMLRYFELLAPIGIDRTTVTEPKLFLSAEELAWAKAQQAEAGGSTAVAHFTSAWTFKSWEDARAAEIIDWLGTETGKTVWFTCGPDSRELARATAILKLCRTRPKTRFAELSLRQLAALIAVSSVFVGVDTAPMHIAAAVGTPLVAIFGPTSSLLWGPRSARAIVTQGKCPCQEQTKQLCNWSETRACLLEVTTQQVKDAIQLVMKQKDIPAHLEPAG